MTSENIHIKWDFKATTDEIVRVLNDALIEAGVDLLDRSGLLRVIDIDTASDHGDNVCMVIRPFDPQKDLP